MKITAEDTLLVKMISKSKHLSFLIALGILSLSCGRQMGTSVIGHPAAEPVALWPILFLDARGDQGQMVVTGLYPDGRRVAIPHQPFSVTPVVPTWSPDGTWYAYVRQDIGREKAASEVGNLRGDVKTIVTVDGQYIAPWPIWSPDGKKIAVIISGNQPAGPVITVIDGIEEKIQSRYALPPSASRGGNVNFRWSRDGQKILLAGQDDIIIVDTVKRVFNTLGVKVFRVEWDPEGNGVYYFGILTSPGPRGIGSSSELGDFYFRPLDSAKPIKMMNQEQIKALGLDNSPFVDLSLSPKGSKLAIWGTSSSASEGTVIHIYDLTGGHSVAFTRPAKTFRTNDGIAALKWSPNETEVVAATIGRDSAVNIKLLRLSTGEWNTLARVGRELKGEALGALMMIYTLSERIISWAE